MASLLRESRGAAAGDLNLVADLSVMGLGAFPVVANGVVSPLLAVAAGVAAPDGREDALGRGVAAAFARALGDRVPVQPLVPEAVANEAQVRRRDDLGRPAREAGRQRQDARNALPLGRVVAQQAAGIQRDAVLCQGGEQA